MSPNPIPPQFARSRLTVAARPAETEPPAFRRELARLVSQRLLPLTQQGASLSGAGQGANQFKARLQEAHTFLRVFWTQTQSMQDFRDGLTALNRAAVIARKGGLPDAFVRLSKEIGIARRGLEDEARRLANAPPPPVQFQPPNKPSAPGRTSDLVTRFEEAVRGLMASASGGDDRSRERYQTLRILLTHGRKAGLAAAAHVAKIWQQEVFGPAEKTAVANVFTMIQAEQTQLGAVWAQYEIPLAEAKLAALSILDAFGTTAACIGPWLTSERARIQHADVGWEAGDSLEAAAQKGGVSEQEMAYVECAAKVLLFADS